MVSSYNELGVDALDPLQLLDLLVRVLHTQDYTALQQLEAAISLIPLVSSRFPCLHSQKKCYNVTRKEALQDVQQKPKVLPAKKGPNRKGSRINGPGYPHGNQPL